VFADERLNALVFAAEAFAETFLLSEGFHDATREDLRSLANWLLARALEHDKPSLLFQLTREHLLAEKIVRPGVTLLERLVMAARERGHRETFHRLASLFTNERLLTFDSLLI
jgi:hypothetical protein